MLRTNTKKAKENIRKYIIEHYDVEDYEMENSNNFDIVKGQIWSIFMNEVGKWNGSHYDSFKYWCQGLPSALDTCYYYNRSAVEDLGEILEESEEERNHYSEEQAEERLTYLIYRELRG